MLAEKQVEQLKKLLLLKIGDPEKPNEYYINLSLDLATQKIENYCSIDSIPVGLYQVLTDMARDYYLYYQSILQAAKSTDPEPGNIMDVSLKAVTEVKMGDTQIKLNGSLLEDDQTKLQWTAHTINLDAILEPYKSDLVEYRRLVW